MTDTSSDVYQQLLFYLVRSTCLESAEKELCMLADAVWNQGWEPDLNKLPEHAERKAAYLVDFFFSNSVVPAERCLRVQKKLTKLKESLLVAGETPEPFYTSEAPPKTNRDSLSRKWGLSAGFHPKKVKGLMDMQRRVNRQAV